MSNPYEWVTGNGTLRNRRDIEEMQTDPNKTTSANSFSWVIKGNITMELAKNAKSILDVGCGWGRELIRSRNAVGIDICFPFLKTARNYVKKSVIRADAHHPPFRENSFDFVIISEVLEHLNNPAKTLIEFRRILKPQGKLLIQTPNKALTFGKLISKERCGHVHEFTFPELENLLKSLEFNVLRRTGSTIPYIPSTSRFEKLNENSIFFGLWKLLNRTIPIKWDIIVLSELSDKISEGKSLKLQELNHTLSSEEGKRCNAS